MRKVSIAVFSFRLRAFRENDDSPAAKHGILPMVTIVTAMLRFAFAVFRN
jgi:hypothetical protein